MSRWKSYWPLAHPFLLAAAPVIYIYTKNYQESEGSYVLLFTGLAVALAATLFSFVRLFVVRDGARAAAIVSVFLLLFFTYGRAFQSLVNTWPLVSFKFWHWMLMTTSMVTLIAAIVIFRTIRREMLQVSRFVTVAAVVFLLFSTGRIIKQETSYHLSRKAEAVATMLQPLEDYPPRAPLTADSQDHPDVYYIILDAYARADVLQWLYSYDNTPLLDQLRARGFYVADKSCSNYPFTFLSLASSTNLRYLDDLVQRRDGYKPQVLTICELVRNQLLGRIFQSKGYRFVHLRTNFFPTSCSHIADAQFGLRPQWLQSGFSQALLQTTMLRLFEPSVAQQHLHAFRTLMEIPSVAGPTFTFAHLLVPHNPFVFDRNGRTIRDVPQMMQICDNAYLDQPGGTAYPEQIRFVNKKVLELVDHILANSKTPPIIILQGDHGSGMTAPIDEVTLERLDEFALERMPIFNVYYVPERLKKKLYPTISPVNSFRLLLTECFGEHFDQLPDRHYVGWYNDPFELRDVTALVHDPAVYDRAVASRIKPAESPARR